MIENDSVADVPRLLVIIWSASFELTAGVTVKTVKNDKHYTTN